MFRCVCARIYFPTPPHKQDVTQGQFLSRFEFRVYSLFHRLPCQG